MRAFRLWVEVDEGSVELLYHSGYPSRRYGHPDQWYEGEPDSIEILVAPTEDQLYAPQGSPFYERMLAEARQQAGPRPAFA